VFVKLPEAEREAALKVPGAKPFEPMKGRPMREYVVLPPAAWADKKKAGAWIRDSLDFVAAAGPKQAKPRK
jgi:hypothetical protein